MSPFVTPAWLAAHLDDPDVSIVDGSWYLPVTERDPAAEYASGHIPGAVRIDLDQVADRASELPHMLPRPADFAAAVGELGIGEDDTVVVYDGAGLFSAPRVWWMFRAMGARDVRILDGGFPAWTAGGHPIESGPRRTSPRRTHRTFVARPDVTVVADLVDVRHALNTGAAQVVDARSAERFAGTAPEPRPGLRAGHLPGSVNLPYTEVVADGRLADPASIVAAVQAAGIDVTRPVITTCGSGVTAAVLWVALDAIGHPPTALYDGSFTEWSGRADTQVVGASQR
jgi:thiosulfate/3-mercaptopyruvate sulfurtransferase